MSVKEDYMAYKNQQTLRPGDFHDRRKLQSFLRNRLDEIWQEGFTFSNGGLFSNYMTRYALGFAYYDCRPSSFCKEKCYGLPLGSVSDFNMLRLSVVTSESLKTGDNRYMNAVIQQLRKEPLECLKIGHWGDAVPEQIPNVAEIVRMFPSMTFWWYTRKKEIAMKVNQLGMKNLRAYLSLDPDPKTPYPNSDEYPYGITYVCGENHQHPRHDDIINDIRLVAIFSLKKGKAVEDPVKMGLANHPRICIEKKRKAQTHRRGELLCLACRGRCNFEQE